MAWMKSPKKLTWKQKKARAKAAADALRKRLKDGGHMLPDADLYGKPKEASPAPTMPKPHTGPVAMHISDSMQKGGSCGLTAQFDSSAAASQRDVERHDRWQRDQPYDKGHRSRERRRRRNIADNKRRVNL